MKKPLLLSILYSCFFFPCSSSITRDNNTDYLLPEYQVTTLQNRVDSLISVLNEKKTPAALLKQTKKAINNRNANNPNSLSTNKRDKADQANYNREKTETKTISTDKPKKETQVYKVRTGTLCCDGSRSYATGRGRLLTS